jgi:hypothetical protein
MPDQHGAYSYMKKEVFETDGDIDVLFLGSSVLWNAIDAKQVENALSESLGRKATVVVLGFNFNALDIPYAVMRDLVERRRVRLVVFSVPRLPFTEGPSTTSYKFLRYSDHPEVVADLSLQSKVSLYACNVLRSPNDLLFMVRPDRSAQSRFADELGANKELMGMERDPETFLHFAPPVPAIPVSELIFSESSNDNFVFTNDELGSHQDAYMRHLERLLRERDIPLAMLNVPQYSERANDKVVGRFDWSKRFGREIPLIGVPPNL